MPHFLHYNASWKIFSAQRQSDFKAAQSAFLKSEQGVLVSMDISIMIG